MAVSRPITKINSGTYFAEQQKIKKCASIVYPVRKNSLASPVYGVNFITVETTLLDSDLNENPHVRRQLEKIGTVASCGPSGNIYVNIDRVSYWPMWAWGAVLLCVGLVNIYWLYATKEWIYDAILVYSVLYGSA